MPYAVLITGAGSGLGHGFAQHYLSQPDTTVIAADRTYNPDLPLKATSPNTTLHKLTFDLSSEASITSLIVATKEILISLSTSSSSSDIGGDGEDHSHHLDLLIHSAGIRGLVPTIESKYPDDVAAAETLSVMSTETLIRTFTINTAGTFTLLQGAYLSGLFYPPRESTTHASDLVQNETPDKSHLPENNTNTNTNDTSHLLLNNHNHDTTTSSKSTKIILMTSRMGSISYNTTGSAYAYRASKAALNAIVKSMSIDLPHVTFKLVHPGRVETGLTKCREEGAIEVDESVGQMVEWIERCGGDGRGEEMFVDRFGIGIGW